MLEHRAGSRGVPGLVETLTRELERLTAHRVVGLPEARRRLGPTLDAEVARCQGNPPCLSHIGVRLGCDEVILVGVSQLGDVILAIQRLDVSGGTVKGRLADSVSPDQTLTTEDVDRYLRRLLPPEHFRRFGRIAIRTDKDGDEVFLDQQFRGKTPLPPLRVAAPARYSLRVSRPGGYQDFMARLDLLPEAQVEVNPTFSRSADEAPWYKRWWVWAIVGGAVAAGAATALGIALTQGPDTVPAYIEVGP